MTKRPYAFIGCSKEGLDYAKAIQQNLDCVCETHIWHQGIFGLSDGSLENLVKSLDRFDFGILVITPDDLTTSRGVRSPTPRDNVIFELGLFIGGLGRERVFMVIDRSTSPKLPSDLAGITPATFVPPENGNAQSAVGAACTAIENKIIEMGQRKPKTPETLTNDYEKDLLIITTYLQSKNYTHISFDGLKKYVDNKFDENYLSNLINAFPNKITRANLRGELGIKLLEKTTNTVTDELSTDIKNSLIRYKVAKLATTELKRVIGSLSKAKFDFKRISEISDEVVISKKRTEELIKHLIEHGFAEKRTGFEGEDFLRLRKIPLRIYSASYTWPTGQIELTDKVIELTSKDIFKGIVDPKTFGIGDPAYGTTKTLTIHYRLRGIEKSIGPLSDGSTFEIK